MITDSIVVFLSLPFPNNPTFLSSPGPQLPAPCQEGEETLLGRQGGDGAAEDGAGVEAGAGAPCILCSLTCVFLRHRENVSQIICFRYTTMVADFLLTFRLDTNLFPGQGGPVRARQAHLPHLQLQLRVFR